MAIDPFIARGAQHPAPQSPQLVRGLSLSSAVSLNMIDMIGVGPFITLPLIIGAMGGPQAMLGWVLGAIFALCDGMVWAELGAAYPGAGGSYRYLNEIYGARRWGRLLSFLFIWQLSFSAPLSIASGAIGFSQYASYIWPALQRSLLAYGKQFTLPFLGSFDISVRLGNSTLLAMAACLAAVSLLYRRITAVGALSKLLWLGVVGTVVWIVVTGLTHFHAAQAFDFPAGAFTLSRNFFTGLGAAMLLATYDYWGYYNVCFLGGEVKDPAKNIPQALIYSIIAVGCMYVIMNISILGIVPWREIDQAARSDSHYFIVSVFMQRAYGHWAGVFASVLVMWTAFASIFSLLLGYSRIPYAAALHGNYFRVFARLHPRHHIPDVSLVVLGVTATMFCLLRLADVIAALVVIRIMIQFLVQAVGLIVLRSRHPEAPRPFRMWLYPLPAALAILGFLYVLISRVNFFKQVRYGIVIIVAGLAVYLFRAWKNKEWPFAKSLPAHPAGFEPSEL